MRQVIDIHYQNAVNVYNEDCLLPIRIVDLGCDNGCFIIEECIGVDPYIECCM